MRTVVWPSNGAPGANDISCSMTVSGRTSPQSWRGSAPTFLGLRRVHHGPYLGRFHVAAEADSRPVGGLTDLDSDADVPHLLAMRGKGSPREQTKALVSRRSARVSRVRIPSSAPTPIEEEWESTCLLGRVPRASMWPWQPYPTPTSPESARTALNVSLPNTAARRASKRLCADDLSPSLTAGLHGTPASPSGRACRSLAPLRRH
jgi:hypothetical protein